jgi:hypothetical protein
MFQIQRIDYIRIKKYFCPTEFSPANMKALPIPVLTGHSTLAVFPCGPQDKKVIT